MSFSSDAKAELSMLPITDMCCACAELSAIVAFAGRLRRTDGRYVFSVITENAKVAKRVYDLIKFVFGIVSKIRINKNKSSTYNVCVIDDNDILTILKTLDLIPDYATIDKILGITLNLELMEKKCCKKAFIRGAFIVAGAIINPEKNYHMEFVTHRYRLHHQFSEIISYFGLSPKTVVRKSNYVVYFKNSEQIGDMLAIIGASGALMEYHNTLIYKDIRNTINRQQNCDMANLEKTISAASRQKAAIEKLKRKNVFDKLPDQLRQVAQLRLEYDDMSLVELGKMLNPPIGKSGINHRLRKIVEIAEKYEEQ